MISAFFLGPKHWEIIQRKLYVSLFSVDMNDLVAFVYSTSGRAKSSKIRPQCKQKVVYPRSFKKRLKPEHVKIWSELCPHKLWCTFGRSFLQEKSHMKNNEFMNIWTIMCLSWGCHDHGQHSGFVRSFIGLWSQIRTFTHGFR